MSQIKETLDYIKTEMTRPSVIFHPNLTIDHTVTGVPRRWICWLKGGVHAYGSSPDEATRNFDSEWYMRLG